MSRTTPTPPVFGEDDDDAFEELGREATEWVSFGVDESGTNEGGVREDDDFDGLNLNADVDADKHKDTPTTTMRENVVETTMASPSSSSSPSASSVRRLTAECARLRELLDDAEANALAAVSALDRERAEWKIERVRAQKLVRAAMVGDNDDSGGDDDGANIATRVVFAFANCGKTPRRAELDAFVARARAGKRHASNEKDVGGGGGGLRITLAEAETMCEDFRIMDAALQSAKSESTAREALLAQTQAELEASTRRLKDHDEAHALLTAEIGDLREALRASKTEANALAEEVTSMSESLTRAKTDALEWKNAAATLKEMNGGADGLTSGSAKGAKDPILVLELECAIEALTTTRAELEESESRLKEMTRRADLAEKREAVAAAALAASESHGASDVSRRASGNTASREVRERLERTEIRVAQLTRRLESIDAEHDAEMENLRKEHERVCLNVKMQRLTTDDAAELARVEIIDATRAAAERAAEERDAHWRRILEDERECHQNQIEQMKREVQDEIVSKNFKLTRLKRDLVQMLKDAA